MGSPTLDLTGPAGEQVTAAAVATFTLPSPEQTAASAAQTGALKDMAAAMRDGAQAVGALAGTLDTPRPDHEVWLEAALASLQNPLGGGAVAAAANADAVLAAYRSRFVTVPEPA